MKAIAISFICVFYILNTAAAKYDDGRLELEVEVRFVTTNIIKNESPDFSSKTTPTKIEKNIPKNTLIKIPTYSRYLLFSNEKSNSNNLNALFDLGESNKKLTRDESSLPHNQTSSKTIRTRNISTLAKTSRTTIKTSQQDDLELSSFVSESFALDYLMEKKTSTTPVSNVIYTQSEKIGKMKFKAKLRSVSLTVFF